MNQSLPRLLSFSSADFGYDKPNATSFINLPALIPIFGLSREYPNSLKSNLFCYIFHGYMFKEDNGFKSSTKESS